jgi:hypothetical protein
MPRAAPFCGRRGARSFGMHRVTHTADLACHRRFIGVTDRLKALISKDGKSF